MFIVEADWQMDRSPSRQRVIVTGIDANGQEHWRRHIDDVVYEMSFDDGRGGIILVVDVVANWTSIVLRLDGAQGAESWRYLSRGQMCGKHLLPASHAVRREGTIFLVETLHGHGFRCHCARR
jgi:hypothetical protein